MDSLGQRSEPPGGCCAPSQLPPRPLSPDRCAPWERGGLGPSRLPRALWGSRRPWRVLWGHRECRQSWGTNEGPQQPSTKLWLRVSASRRWTGLWVSGRGLSEAPRNARFLPFRRGGGQSPKPFGEIPSGSHPAGLRILAAGGLATRHRHLCVVTGQPRHGQRPQAGGGSPPSRSRLKPPRPGCAPPPPLPAAAPRSPHT